MINNYEELFQIFVNMDMEERVARGKEGFLEYYNFVNGLDLSDQDKGRTIADLFKYFVSADKTASSEEFELFQRITGIENYDVNKFYEITNRGSDPDFKKYFVKLVNLMPQDVKVAAAFVGLVILSADDQMTPEEQDLFKVFLESNSEE